MAETQNLINQANSGMLDVRQLVNMQIQGGPPNITQEQTPPDTGGFNVRSLLRQAEQAEMQAQPQPQISPEAIQQRQTGTVTPSGVDQQQEPTVLERHAQMAGIPQENLTATSLTMGPEGEKTIMEIAEEYSGEEFLPVAGGITGAVVGTRLGGRPGGVAGASMLSAFGRYLNDFFGVQETQVSDYVADMMFPIGGAAVSKVGKPLAKQLPAVQSEMTKKAISISDDLAKLAARPEGKKNVDAAYEALRNSKATLPSAPIQDSIAELPPKLQKKVLSDIGFTKPEVVKALTNRNIVRMSPDTLRDFNSRVSHLIEMGFKPNATTKARDIAVALQDVSKKTKKYIGDLAASGDQSAVAIRKANRMAETQKSFEELDTALRAARKTGEDLTETINIGGLYKRFKDMEHISKRGGKSTDKLWKAYRSLERDPERLKIFTDGLERISKYAPDGIKLEGLTGKGARVMREMTDTGILTNLIATKPGQWALEKVVKDKGGIMNTPTLAALGVLVRPLITNRMPDQDPIIQETMGKLTDFRNTVKANRQPQKANQE